MNESEESKNDDFDRFCAKITEVGSIINDMTSSNTEISKKGLERADQYLNKEKLPKMDEDGNFTNFNKSSLNRKVLEKPTEEEPGFSDMSAEEFMAAVEKDANERHKRKFCK